MNDSGLSKTCTNSKVRQLMRRVNQHYDAQVAPSGVRTTQYSLLAHVSRLGPVRPVDLAAAMRMTASTLSRNLLPLVAAGWLSVGAGTDARSRLVQITEAGSAKRLEAKRHWSQAQQKLESLLGPKRVIALHALIDESLALMGTDAPAEHEGH